MNKNNRLDLLDTDKESRVKAEWTIMIYMAGDNNLAEDCVNALMALKSIDSGDHIHVIAQFDPGDPRVSTRRLVINRLSKTKKVKSLVTFTLGKLDEDRVLVVEGTKKFGPRRVNREEIPHVEGVFETDTADPKTLFDFISWSSEEFPAERYMLVLSGHSAGIEDGFLLKDEHPAQAMKLDGLIQVLREVQKELPVKLDILGMDSCLMSMIEICFELQGLVKVLVGSQSMTPNPGWPYSEIIRIMNEQKGKIEAEDLASEIVHAYIRSYVDQAINSGTSTDLAALRIDAASGVADQVKELATEVRAGLKNPSLWPILKPALVLSHWEAQSYNGELFVDLADFCGLLTNHLASAASKPTRDDNVAAIETMMERCKSVQEVIGEMVLEACFCGIDYQYSHGISIYFPWSTIFFNYRNLAFAEGEGGANWFHFLRHYIEGTRRRPRGERGDDKESEDFAQAFILFDSEVFTRKVEPLTHGPSGPSHSMRNPPRRLGRHMIKGCAVLGDI